MGEAKFDSDGIISWGRALNPAECMPLVARIMADGHIDTAMQLPSRNHIDTWVFSPLSVRLNNGRTVLELVWNMFNAGNALKLVLDGIDTIRLLRYFPDSEMGKHADWSPGIAPNRKLSMTLQLSDPTTYDGCDVVMDSVGSHSELFGDATFHIPRPQAMCAVWPSWMAHTVTPLTRGERFALVAWASGPLFR